MADFGSILRSIRNATKPPLQSGGAGEPAESAASPGITLADIILRSSGKSFYWAENPGKSEQYIAHVSAEVSNAKVLEYIVDLGNNQVTFIRQQDLNGELELDDRTKLAVLISRDVTAFDSLFPIKQHADLKWLSEGPEA